MKLNLRLILCVVSDPFRGQDMCDPTSCFILAAPWPWVDVSDGAGIVLESESKQGMAFMPTFPCPFHV